MEYLCSVAKRKVQYFQDINSYLIKSDKELDGFLAVVCEDDIQHTAEEVKKAIANSGEFGNDFKKYHVRIKKA